VCASAACGASSASKEAKAIPEVPAAASDASNKGPSAPLEPGAININTASAEDLQRLPHVGPAVAEKIVAHRRKFGPFKRPEQLMMIDGISDLRFRRIRPLIRVE
jgi:competence protein ComEA